MSRIRHELRRLASLAAPVVVGQLATMTLNVVDTLMVGNVGVQTLAAASLGHVWTAGTMMFAMGLVFGIDPIVSQAHGRGDARAQGLALQRGILLGVLVSIPVSLLWWWTDHAMVLLGQTEELAHLAQTYVAVQIPSLPVFMVFVALRQHQQARGIVRPAMFVAIVANGVNALLNWVLIYGGLGVPALGIVGAGSATALTRGFLLGTLLFLSHRGRLFEGAWSGFERAGWSRSGLRQVFAYGWPIGLTMSFEVWAFQAATLFAGRLGEAQLAAHTIVLSAASVSFMVPMGIGMAAVTRVGNLIGAGRPVAARRAAWVAVATGAGVMTVSAAVFVLARNWIPIPYSPDPGVRALAASVFPVAAAFQLSDGTQVVGSGVLRGMGSTRPAAVFNLVGYYMLALPLAAWLTFSRGWGLHGIWWGLAMGLSAVALMLVAWIARRGPTTVAAIRPSEESI